MRGWVGAEVSPGKIPNDFHSIMVGFDGLFSGLRSGQAQTLRNVGWLVMAMVDYELAATASIWGLSVSPRVKGITKKW